MNDNIIKKIFPSNNLLLDDLLKYDDEGLYSITLPDDANTISKLLLEYSNNIIFDGTAGLGGNTLSFSKNFKQVIAIEMNEHRYNLLVNNLKAYDVKNVTLFNDNCLNHLDLDCDIYFFDPPWGGRSYKDVELLRFKINDTSLYDLINIIKNKNKIICIKIPYNYDMSEFNKFNYKILLIKKYRLIII